MVTIGEKYVERVEKAIVETMVLSELNRNNGMTLDQLVMKVRGVSGFSDIVDEGFIESAVSRLDRDAHVEERDGRYTITDDGREDVQKIQSLFNGVRGVIGETTTGRPSAAATVGGAAPGSATGGVSGRGGATSPAGTRPGERRPGL